VLNIFRRLGDVFYKDTSAPVRRDAALSILPHLPRLQYVLIGFGVDTNIASSIQSFTMRRPSRKPRAKLTAEQLRHLSHLQ